MHGSVPNAMCLEILAARSEPQGRYDIAFMLALPPASRSCFKPCQPYPLAAATNRD